jgi:hypothetical protein
VTVQGLPPPPDETTLPPPPPAERVDLPAPPAGRSPAGRMGPDRPGFVTAAAAILIALGCLSIFGGVGLFALRDAPRIEDLGFGEALPAVAVVAVVLGGLQVGAGLLVLRLSGVGRILGLTLGILGLLGGIGTLAGQEATAGIGLVLNALVVYALLAYRQAFRRRPQG